MNDMAKPVSTPEHGEPFSLIYPRPHSVHIRAGQMKNLRLRLSPEIAGEHRLLLKHFRLRHCPDGVPLRIKTDDSLGEEGYRIDAAPEGITVGAGGPRARFYAMATLCQIIARSGAGACGLPAFQLRDFPALPFRGFMLDVSRGAVPTLAALQDLILRLALLKFNHLSLYIEDTLALEQLSPAGQKKSMLSKAEIRQAVQFARQVHLDVFPSLQSLCHLRQLLRQAPWRRFAQADNPDCVDASSQEATAFIQRFTAEIAETFDSPLINIGMDECEKGPAADLYFDHFLAMHRFFKARGKRVLVWGDMFLKHPNFIKKIPDDVTVLNWDYFSENPEGFRKQIAPFKLHQRQQILCPTTWSWAKFIPAGYKSGPNIEAACTAAWREKLRGVMLTSWGDDGNEYLPDGIAFALFQAGYWNWSARAPSPAAFGIWAGGNPDPDLYHLFTFLGQIDKPLPYSHRYYLYEDPIFAPFSGQGDVKEIINRYDKGAAYLAKRSRNDSPHSRYFHFAESLLRTVAAKVRLSHDWQRDDSDSARHRAGEQCRRLQAALEKLKEEYAAHWRAAYKHEGLFAVLGKLSLIQERLRFLERILEDRPLHAHYRQARDATASAQPYMTVNFQEIFDQ